MLTEENVEKIIYPDANAPEVPEDNFDPEHLTDAQMEQALPKPSGHKLLIALPQVDDTYEGGVIKKVKETIQNETVTSVVAMVLDMGPDAYADPERFPSGPWCAIGNYVLVGPYKGCRFTLNGHEFRIINDDSIEGTVADPRGYRRV